ARDCPRTPPQAEACGSPGPNLSLSRPTRWPCIRVEYLTAKVHFHKPRQGRLSLVRKKESKKNGPDLHWDATSLRIRWKITPVPGEDLAMYHYMFRKLFRSGSRPYTKKATRPRHARPTIETLEERELLDAGVGIGQPRALLDNPALASV